MTDHTASGMPADKITELRLRSEDGACPLGIGDKCWAGGCWIWRHVDNGWQLCKARKQTYDEWLKQRRTEEP